MGIRDEEQWRKDKAVLASVPLDTILQSVLRIVSSLILSSKAPEFQ